MDSKWVVASREENVLDQGEVHVGGFKEHLLLVSALVKVSANVLAGEQYFNILLLGGFGATSF